MMATDPKEYLVEVTININERSVNVLPTHTHLKEHLGEIDDYKSNLYKN